MGSGPGRGRLRRVAVRGGTAWEADWRDASGQRRRKILGKTREAAQHVLDALIRERDLERHGLLAEAGRAMPLERVAEQYLADLATRAKPRTIAAARLALRRAIAGTGARLVRDLRRPDVDAWRKRRLAEGAGHATVNSEVGYLASALAYAVQLGQLAAHPLAGLRKLPTTAQHQRRRARALSEWEIARLFAAAAELDRESRGGIPREWTLRALVLTGARWGEIVRATWADFDAERGTLILRAETTKTQRERVLPLDRGLVETLLGIPAEVARVTGARPKPDEPILRAPRGGAWSAHTGAFRLHLVACCARAGIPPIRVHDLRHTAATRFARHGVGVADAQYLLGHASPTMTLRTYTHVRAEEARAALDSLPPVGRGLADAGSSECLQPNGVDGNVSKALGDGRS